MKTRSYLILIMRGGKPSSEELSDRASAIRRALELADAFDLTETDGNLRLTQAQEDNHVRVIEQTCRDGVQVGYEDIL